MITFLLGLPGSGKSYYAVDRIYNNFSDDKEAKREKKLNFKNCFTNINEFNYDKVKNTSHLDFELLYKILERLHKLYKAKKSDKYLVKFLRRLNLIDTLFVIDEAHNFFDKKDVVLVWWLSYHRHLYHEIILITQNLGLIESKYKAFSEFFYVAKPQSLTLFKSHFKYNIFCSSRLSQNSRSGSIKIKRKKEVFALYKSGDSIKSQNVILKFLVIAIFIALFLFGFIYYNYVYNAPGKEIAHQDNITKSSHNKNDIHQDENLEIHQDKIIENDNKLVVLNCTLSLCSSSDIEIPPQLLKIFIDRGNFELLYMEHINSNLDNFYLNTTKDFYNFLKIKHKGENYEKENSVVDGVNIFGSDS